MTDGSITGLVESPELNSITTRALAHLTANSAVHLSGPMASGKTVLALHLAANLGRPVILMQGDPRYGRTEILGRELSGRRIQETDQYIHSILRMDEAAKSIGEEDRLASACQHGHTLVYDDFTRSSAEANGVLNSVLGEGILHLSSRSRPAQPYLRVHPGFHLILTSNPQEASLNHGHNVLLDRVVTVRLDPYSLKAEVAIVAAKARLPVEEVQRVVDLVRMLRVVSEHGDRPSIRASISIARVLAQLGAKARYNDDTFRWVCRDVLGDSIARLAASEEALPAVVLDEILERLCQESSDFSAALV
jgi:nitric oxide reductase NorQ protein